MRKLTNCPKEKNKVEAVIVVTIGFLSLIVTAIMAPMLLARQINRRDEDIRQEDRAERADVAAQAAEAARLLVESNKRIEQATEDGTRVTVGKLNVIHTLVNSNMTASMNGELNMTKALIVSLKVNVANEQAKGMVTDGALLEIAALEAKVRDLEISLSERAKAAVDADLQIAEAATVAAAKLQEAANAAARERKEIDEYNGT